MCAEGKAVAIAQVCRWFGVPRSTFYGRQYGRRPYTAMAGVPEDLQRWTGKRRVALVLSIVRGETSVAEAARKHGLTVAEVEEWQERFVTAAENALQRAAEG